MSSIAGKDDNRFGVLYVDDEEKSLKYFRKIFGSKAQIYTALNAGEGYHILEKNRDNIGIIMADQRMPGEKGVQFLKNTCNLCPGVLRILITAYSDIDTAIEAVNAAAVYKYITKPWNIPELESILMHGLESFSLRHKRDQLLKEKLSVLQGMITNERLMSFYILTDGMSHYIINSMFSINALLNHWIPGMLEQKNKDSLHDPNFWITKYQEALKQVKKVYDLFSRLNDASLKPTREFRYQVNLPDIVSKAVTLKKFFLKKNNIRVENRIPESLPPMKVNKFQFERLFGLLLDEELINLPDGGQVVFSAQLLDDAAGTHDNSEIRITIKDNGPAALQKAFNPVSNPFLIRKNGQQKFGFNLMACFFIIYHHCGMVTAESHEGKGNTVTMTIPTDPNKINRIWKVNMNQ